MSKMLVSHDFVFESAPYKECHASSVAAVGGKLVATWFGGSRERNPDVGVWVAHHDGARWGLPELVATGEGESGARHACWNPVLHAEPDDSLLLFYRVGPSPASWRGLWRRSGDGGRSWSPPRSLPENIHGPIKNKPVRLACGRLLCGSSTEDDGWRVHLEWTERPEGEWQRTPPLNDGRCLKAIQPTILQHGGERLQILCRTGAGRIASAWSEDAGATWSALELMELPDAGSGLDALTLRDGRHLLVYNHARPAPRLGRIARLPRSLRRAARSPLSLAISQDGVHWQRLADLERGFGEFSYPAIIQDDSGLVHVTYTWKRRRMRHAVLDPELLSS